MKKLNVTILGSTSHIAKGLIYTLPVSYAEVFESDDYIK